MKRQPRIRLFEDEGFIDGFAGGGGASTGIEMALGYSPDVAINHDREALAMHQANHPKTRHIRTNIKTVNFKRVMRGKPVGGAWFSPDCTYHSKARGGKPFRDRNKARRIRGLAWEMVRCAIQTRPRVLFMENVEEIEFWGPLDQRGRPIPEKRGSSWRRFVARLTNLGYVCEWRRLKAKGYGAPTTRTRLFFIARCDGQPIVWPRETHGPGRRPYRTAAECIDFSLPVPSIFLTKAQAKAWGKAHGVAAPKRPLAAATKRRIARGMMRFVIESPEPFIVKFHGEKREGDVRGQRVGEPLLTLDTSNRFALVAPVLVLNSEQRDDRVYRSNEPIRTLTAANCRTYQLVAAFLAKHNGGHEATGQALTRPMDAIVCRENKALVTSHLVKLRGGLTDHVVTAQDLREPAPTLTAGGTHVAEVRAFLVKYYGNEKDGARLDRPLGTVVTKDRFGLVTVTIAGEDYVIVDIGMRMLTPRELFLCQGFPESYQIDCVVKLPGKQPKRLTKKAQTRLVGNSVPPQLAAAIVRANMHVTAERAA